MIDADEPVANTNDAARYRPTRVEIIPGAITENVRRLRTLAPNSLMCAVIKADAYGHGLETGARAALAGGADALAVALVEEAAALRALGIGSPVVLLSEPPRDAAAAVVELELEPMVYSTEFIDALEVAAHRAGTIAAVHLKVDTGMRRVGCEPRDAVELARLIDRSGALRLRGVATHLASADDPRSDQTAQQLATFADVTDRLAAAGFDRLIRHAANSAGTIGHPDSRLDMVRCGIAIYGIEPCEHLEATVELVPALRLTTRLAFVKEVAGGQPVSYGAIHRTDRDTRIGTLQLGYADGLPRGLGRSTRADVLVGGRRCPIIGSVTMDQTMVDLSGTSATVGDEVVLIGRQGEESISANEVAERVGTIGYEIVARLGPRIPRVAATAE